MANELALRQGNKLTLEDSDIVYEDAYENVKRIVNDLKNLLEELYVEMKKVKVIKDTLLSKFKKFLKYAVDCVTSFWKLNILPRFGASFEAILKKIEATYGIIKVKAVSYAAKIKDYVQTVKEMLLKVINATVKACKDA